MPARLVEDNVRTRCNHSGFSVGDAQALRRVDGVDAALIATKGGTLCDCLAAIRDRGETDLMRLDLGSLAVMIRMRDLLSWELIKLDSNCPDGVDADFVIYSCQRWSGLQYPMLPCILLRMSLKETPKTASAMDWRTRM